MSLSIDAFDPFGLQKEASTQSVTLSRERKNDGQSTTQSAKPVVQRVSLERSGKHSRASSTASSTVEDFDPFEIQQQQEEEDENEKEPCHHGVRDLQRQG